MQLILMIIFFASYGLMAQEMTYIGRPFLQKIGAEVETILPPRYLASFSKKIIITEKKFSDSKALNFEDFCSSLSNEEVSVLKGSNISINSRLLDLAENDNLIPHCGSKNFRKIVMGAIVYQLTRLKDHFEKLSLHPDFQRLIGVKKIRKKRGKKIIRISVRAINDSSLAPRLREIFAKNVEYFLLDSEFECRKPATANYLSKILNQRLSGKCQKSDKLLIQSAFPEDNYRRFVSLRSDKIYQIHYLFAGRGRALMSRWGHAMFRVVICSPFRKKIGPECLNDISHHVVINYRANVDDVTINYLKGVLGDYSSQMYVQSFLEILQEYTKFELRDLYSIPLNLTNKERDDFIDLSLERFWSYEGKYYFLTNNCGTEALKHLAFPLDEGRSKLINSFTPLSIYRDITKSKNDLSSFEVNGSERKELVEKGILIEGQYKKLSQTFNDIKFYLTSYPELNFDQFISKIKGEERLKIYRNLFSILQNLSSEEKIQIATKVNYLERYLFSRYIYKISSLMMKKDHKPSLDEDYMREMKNDSKFLSLRPWDIVRTSYGVPLIEEFEKQYSTFLSQHLSQKVSQNDQSENWVEIMLKKPEFTEQAKEIYSMKKINQLVSEYLKTTIIPVSLKESL